MAYSEIEEWIADSLQDNVPLLEDDESPDFSGFQKHIRSVLRDSIPAAAIAAAGLTSATDFYDQLVDGDDRDRLSEAVGLIVAAKTIGPLSTGGANGQLLSEKTADVSRTFANEPGNKAEWEARAARLLAGCSFAPTSSSGLGRLTVFGANGPFRARDEDRASRDDWRRDPLS